MRNNTKVIEINSRKKPIALVPNRLTEARIIARLTQTQLAARINVSRQAISNYEKGNRVPDPETFHKILQELKQPIKFFTNTSYPVFGQQGANFFRKKGVDNKWKNRACAIYASWFTASVKLLEPFLNLPEVKLPSFEPINKVANNYTKEEIEQYAEKLREELGLGLGPISNVMGLLEQMGIFICHLALEKENIDAFSYWSGDRPFIFLASDKKSAVRRRFDATHELAHLCLHTWVTEEELDDPKRLKQIEKEADHFAGAFLLPRRSFLNEIYSTKVESFIHLKSRWKVSIQSMVQRCKQLGIFDEYQILNLQKQISYKKWRTNEPLDSGPGALAFEEPLLLNYVVKKLIKSGKFTFDELINELPLSIEILKQFFNLSESYFAESVHKKLCISKFN
ncbi:ImmA/IrrE family metallo-endopeptidase [Bartonella sp. DGB1]|uniref:ImmA/IrrE family metallo-endopeptidase n=1 Tax=Bartonella sp. DGB1 TaxID=3239807 RepID=UPI003525261A